MRSPIKLKTSLEILSVSISIVRTVTMIVLTRSFDHKLLLLGWSWFACLDIKDVADIV